MLDADGNEIDFTNKKSVEQFAKSWNGTSLEIGNGYKIWATNSDIKRDVEKKKHGILDSGKGRAVAQLNKILGNCVFLIQELLILK